MTLNEIEVLGTGFNDDSCTPTALAIVCGRTGTPAVGALIRMLPEVVLVPTHELIRV